MTCLVAYEPLTASTSAKTFGIVKHFQADKTRTACINAFNKELEQASLVIVDFYADWCGPCKALSPCLDALAKEFPQILILKVNAETYESIANTYGVKSFPTLLFFKDGNTKQPKERIVGKKSKAEITKVIKKHL